MEQIRWGIIGAGSIAKNRTIPGLLQAEHARLQAVMTTTMAKSQAIAAEFGAPGAYDTVEALLADPEVDAVYIATPVYLHLPQIKLAAAAGKQILCEKPLGLNAAEAQEAIDVCKAAGVTLAVGFMMRYGAHLNQMKAALAEGKLGKLVAGFGQFSCWVEPRPGGFWATTMEQAGGGPIMDMGIHLIDLIHYVTGQKITHVTAMQECVAFDAPEYTVDDTSSAILRLESGAQFVIQTLFNVPDSASCWRFDLMGTRGRMLGENIIGQEDTGKLRCALLQAGEDPCGAMLPEEDWPTAFCNLYTREIEQFSLAVLNNRPVDVPPETALAAQKVIDAAYESSRTGKTVPVE